MSSDNNSFSHELVVVYNTIVACVLQLEKEMRVLGLYGAFLRSNIYKDANDFLYIKIYSYITNGSNQKWDEYKSLINQVMFIIVE